MSCSNWNHHLIRAWCHVGYLYPGSAVSPPPPRVGPVLFTPFHSSLINPLVSSCSALRRPLNARLIHPLRPSFLGNIIIFHLLKNQGCRHENIYVRRTQMKQWVRDRTFRRLNTTRGTVNGSSWWDIRPSYTYCRLREKGWRKPTTIRLVVLFKPFV